MSGQPPLPITGRCYCGATTLRAMALPHAVAYCHCTDCKRVTGAPVAAFAAFAPEDLSWTPSPGRAVSVTQGVTRTFCPDCGSPLTGRYDYLPEAVYVPIGLLDQADALPPEIHSHHDNRLQWLHLTDDLPRFETSGRDHLTRDLSD